MRFLPFISGKSDRRQLMVLIGLLATSRIFFYVYLNYTMDDAFITYRYARNMANGDGFVYNIGERVQGTSTPLYTLILAGCGALFGTEQIPTASRTIAFVADIVSLVMLWRLLSPLNASARFLTCALFAMYPKVVLVSISGMETSLVVMFMLASWLLLFDMKKTGAALAVLSLLLLCRIDGIVWIVVCLWWVGWSQVRASLGTARLIGIAMYAIWLVFSRLYFGSILPHAVEAKSVSYPHLFPWFDPVRVLGGYFPFEGFKGQPLILRTIAVPVLLAPVIVQFVRSIRSRSALVVFPVFFLAYSLLFSLGRTVMVDWYYFPGYVAYFVCIGALVDGLIRSPGRKLIEEFMRIAFKPALVLVLAGLLFVGATRWEKKLVGFHVNQNIPIGEWLKEHGGSSVQVLLEPIGYIGWISGSYVHDFIGLVSPSVIATRKRHTKSDAWFVEYIQQKRPDFIILRDWEIPANRLFNGFGDGIFKNDAERSWYAKNYSLVDWSSGKKAWLEHGSLVLYQRVDVGVR